MAALVTRTRRGVQTSLVERLKNTPEDPPSLRAVLAVSGGLAHAGAEWRRLLGWSLADLAVGTFIERVHPDDLDTAVRAIHAAYAGGAPVSFICRFAHRDGSYVRIHWQAAPRPDQLDLDLMGTLARNSPPDPPK